MAKKELGPAQLAVAQACMTALKDVAGPCVVGVSGGADSLAMAAGVAWVTRREPIQPLAVVVDHQLQPGSAEVAERAAATCRELGLEAHVVSAVVGSVGGVEAAARQARREALEAAGDGPILLGHTLDDQAESVLLGLARGSGGRSLAGMRPVLGRYRRPLLGLRRAQTESACAQWGITPWQDPMNRDEHFLRVRARRAVAALEGDLGPGFALALARSAQLLADDVDYLDSLVAHMPLAAELSVAELAGLPAALRTRLIRRWLQAHHVTAGFSDITRVDELVTTWRGQGPLDVPGARVARVGGRLAILGGTGV